MTERDNLRRMLTGEGPHHLPVDVWMTAPSLDMVEAHTGCRDEVRALGLSVEPFAGSAGTTHHFFSDRFIPGEGVVTWLNTPDGVEPLELRGIADPMGRIWLDLKSSGLPPASYQIVLYGARSNLTGVASFNVQ